MDEVKKWKKRMLKVEEKDHVKRYVASFCYSHHINAYWGIIKKIIFFYKRIYIERKWRKNGTFCIMQYASTIVY